MFMPSRVIRGEILSSRSLARVSRDAANLFMRLTLAVDEFGRMDGRWRVIHGEVYGDRDDTSVADVERWVGELVAEGCVDRYEAGRDPVLRLPSTEKHRAKRNRAGESKYPCRCGTYGPCECSPHVSASSDGEKREEIISDASGSGGLGVNGFGSGGHWVAQAPEAGAPASAPEVFDPPPKRKLMAQPPEATGFAQQFLSAMKATNPSARDPTPAAWSDWVNEARLMIERDQRPLEEIQALAEWLFNSPGRDAQFWRGNVLSVPKFRAQYVQLMAKKNLNEASDARPERRPGPVERAAQNILRRAAQGNA
jgi:hypothetical protein